jgi:cytochrome c oxidase cbb3-type subunit IV
VSTQSTYDALRHFADSWGLVVMTVSFLALAAWPFRPGARRDAETAASSIFGDDENGD